MSPREMQEHFEAFYEDFYCEAALFGKLEEVVVAENGNDHLMGNVYARFKYEEDAQKAKDSFNSRWYAGRPIYCELSPVTDLEKHVVGSMNKTIAIEEIYVISYTPKDHRSSF